MVAPTHAVTDTLRTMTSSGFSLSGSFWSFFGTFHKGHRLVWKIFRTAKKYKNQDCFTPLVGGAVIHTFAGKNKGVFLFAQTLFIALAISECVEQCLKIQHSVETLKDVFSGRYVIPVYKKWAKKAEDIFLSPSTRDAFLRKWYAFWHLVKVVCYCVWNILKSLWIMSHSFADAVHMFTLNANSDDIEKHLAIVEVVSNGKALWKSVTETIPNLAKRLEMNEMTVDTLFQRLGSGWTVKKMIEACGKLGGVSTKVKEAFKDMGKEAKLTREQFKDMFSCKPAKKKEDCYLLPMYRKPSKFYAGLIASKNQPPNSPTKQFEYVHRSPQQIPKALQFGVVSG